MNDLKIHIVCCSDHNYVMPCGVMLKSLLVNNCSHSFCIHLIVDESFTDEDKNKIRSIVETEHGGKLDFLYFSNLPIEEFPKIGNHTHVSKASYYRLFMSSILPMDIEKVLYLDVDMVVMGDISDLWNYNIDGFAFAGAIDQETDAIEHYNRMKYGRDYSVINAGVLLINLKYWREQGLQEKFISFMNLHQDRILFHDQDVLNCVLYDQKVLLPLQYNVQPAFFYHPSLVRYDMEKYQQAVMEAKNNPIVLHFSTKYKPWEEDCFHPMKSEFIKYQSMTPWKGVVNEMKVERMTFRQVLYDVLLLLGIKKRKKVYGSRWLFE